MFKDLLETNKRNIIEYKKELECAGYYINTIRGRYGGYSLDKTKLMPIMHLTASFYGLKVPHLSPPPQCHATDVQGGCGLIHRKQSIFLRCGLHGIALVLPFIKHFFQVSHTYNNLHVSACLHHLSYSHFFLPFRFFPQRSRVAHGRSPGRALLAH